VPGITIDYLDLIYKLIASSVVALAVWIAYHIVANVLRRQVKDPTHMHTLRMLVRNALLFGGSVIVLLIWLGVGSNFTVAMGILGAGIAFASQEVIGSFAGYLNIVSGGIYRIGDRVRIGNVVGDVMDISILRTTVMEIGEWVQADQYTGRIVTVANRAVFGDPVHNYTQHWGYLWDEIMVPVTYASDWQRATEIMLELGQHYTAELHADAEAKLQRMIDRYPLQLTSVAPTIYLTMTDNWVEVTLRYIVDAMQRRKTKAELNQELLQRFQAEPDITVASMTVEIVGLPPLRGAAGPVRDA
jgi:small-conductance mechanosensitive channel